MIGALNLRTDLRVALCRRSELSATPANKSMQTAAQTEIPTPRSGMRRRVTEFGRLRSLGGLSRRTLNEAYEPLLAIDDDFGSHPAVPRVCGGLQPRTRWLPLQSSSRHEFGCSSAPADRPRAERRPAVGSMRTGRQAFLKSTRAAWLCESQISSQFWGRVPATKSVPAHPDTGYTGRR